MLNFGLNNQIVKVLTKTKASFNYHCLLKTMFRNVFLFYKMSFRRKYLLVLTLILACYTYLLMRFFKAKAVFGTTASMPNIATSKISQELVRDITFAIRTVAKYIPFENVCRHQAYQAKLLCKRYTIPYQIFVGFKKSVESGKIEGHAWTVVQDELITGFCNPTEYTIQAIYS